MQETDLTRGLDFSGEISSDINAVPLLHIEKLTKKFADNEVLKGITLDIYKGDVVCIIGPSGSGKSTFLRCLNRIEEPSSGKIIFDGENIFLRLCSFAPRILMYFLSTVYSSISF